MFDYKSECEEQQQLKHYFFVVFYYIFANNYKQIHIVYRNICKKLIILQTDSQ